MLFFDSIHYAYHKRPVLKDVSFTAAPGEITCVVGPSGCGKTTLLALAAGLLDMQEGTLRLDDVVLARPGMSLPPEQRPVGLVFQEGALFPHLSVAGNIGFGVSSAERSTRVAELLDMVGLEQEAQRHPHTLSGGQRQRVALARALAPRPRALLFDEPYANLDQELRQALRLEARDMVRETGTIGVFVTHDPDDVMALADQVVVLSEGELLQSGTPLALFEAPASAVVAQLFGRAQSLDAIFQADGLQTIFGTWPLEVLAPASDLKSLEPGDMLELMLRPGALRLEDCLPGPEGSDPIVHEVRLAGTDDLVELVSGRAGEHVGGHGKGPVERLFVRLARPHALKPGDRVRVLPRPGSVFAFAPG